ncbi:MAG: transglutaminase domain-containing protein [Spirochaetales bacterium]|nr:transglutaminase domain-containing protein [Spirochaetales bacterium]
MKKNIILYHIIPGALFAALVLLFSVSMAISRTTPVIHSLEPSQVSPGDLMVLSGRNFGINRGKVYLDNRVLTASFIESWSESMIKLRVPPIKASGLISVETGGGRSDGALFVLSERVPDLAAGAFLPGKPYLSGINKSRFYPGDLVILKGDKMGYRKKNSRILVSTALNPPGNLLDVPDEQNYTAVPEDHIYSWQDDGVSFFLPQEAREGAVYIQTASGFSNPVSIDVIRSGTYSLSDTRVLSLSQEILLSRIGALPGNSLVLYVPEPSDRMEQTLLSRPDSTGIVVLEELESGESFSIRNEYDVELSAVRYEINQSDIPYEYSNKFMLESWTASTESLPASDLRRTALAVIKRETHPYKKASLLFDYVVWKMIPELENPERDPLNWLSSRTTDALGYASLFVTLCRSVDLPARVVSGLWYDDESERSVVHHWAEVYLPRFGWFPVDTAASDRVLEAAAGIEERETPPGGFGTLDNGYIAFSRGEGIYPLQTDRGRTGSSAPYSRQNVYAEWIGNLESCSINWKDIDIMPQQ